jgi:phospholipid/cholesterol/gamma-HCH transport system permease protein
MLALDAPESPQLQRDDGDDGATRVVLRGAWTLHRLAPQYKQIERELTALRRAPAPVEWDLRAITSLDGSGAVLLWRSWRRKRPPRLRLQPEHERLLGALEKLRTAGLARRRLVLPTQRLWGAVDAMVENIADAVALMGRLLLDGFGWLRRPGRIAWREISANVYRAGAQALPITALVGFLVGVTLSFLSSRQLKSFGADIFIINILGVSVWRELGPLLSAILIAGRSGSSMTAQLGVMRVTQELDALSVMGISHTSRLVLPKVLALALAMPLVTVWTCIIMLIGGMVAAHAQLGLDYSQFVRGLPGAVAPANLTLGLGKAVGFGALIALVACHCGLRVKPDTESLGAGTTTSVVTAITAVIILDAIVAVLFSDLGI